MTDSRFCQLFFEDDSYFKSLVQCLNCIISAGFFVKDFFIRYIIVVDVFNLIECQL